MNSDVQITTANNYIHPSKIICVHTYCCSWRELRSWKSQDREAEDKPSRFADFSRQITVLPVKDN